MNNWVRNNGEMTPTGVKRKYSEKDLYQKQLSHHKSHLELNTDLHLNLNTALFFV